MLIPGLAVVLHGGQEVTFLDYLSRVLIYLVAFGGIALVAYWVSLVSSYVQSVVVVGDADHEIER